MTVRRSIFTFAMLMVPRLALACPVCFGQNDSPLAKALNLGILAMLVVVAGVLASLIAASAARRSSRSRPTPPTARRS